MSTDKEPTRIRVQLPLPLDVVVSLTRAVGVLYPNAMIDNTDSRHLTFVVDQSDRAPRVSKKALAAAKAESSEHEAQATNFKDGTLTTTVPEALEVFAEYAYIALIGTDGAVNYLEQKMHHKASGRDLVFCVAWSKGQTPHELRMAAENRADELQRRIDDADD